MSPFIPKSTMPHRLFTCFSALANCCKRGCENYTKRIFATSMAPKAFMATCWALSA